MFTADVQAMVVTPAMSYHVLPEVTDHPESPKQTRCYVWLMSMPFAEQHAVHGGC